AEDDGAEDEAVVVDFKTDRRYRPGAHRAQLLLYQEAARELTGRSVRGYVYYVRDGRLEAASNTM
ncbi:MAG: PD-(D/E)XK nuclease family protein, partial [Spirochaetaceae bacterium]